MALLNIILLIAAAGAVVFAIWWAFFDTYHFAVVQPGVLYRDGVRDMRVFAAMNRRVKLKTIVSLVDDEEFAKEPFLSEEAWCRSHGVRIIHIPVTLGGWPDTGQVRQFLEAVKNPANQPVLVHCAQGVRRTGMMVAAYQESVLGFTADHAKSAMLTFGHSQRTVGDVKRFIDIYDPKSEEVTQALEISKE
jgi:protein tyrosine phosphatase (PTP) superfamily phosphohydrolase (DUF442 family)